MPLDSPLPPDWQATMVEMIRGVRPLDGAWFAGGPALSPVRQIDIYRNQYDIRLPEAVQTDMLGLTAMVGEEGMAGLVRDYVADHPSRSWTLNRSASHIVAWLESRDPPVPPAWVDMARLDRAVMDGFEAADGERLTPEDLVTTPHLALPPHVTLLRLRFNVHDVRSALLDDEDAPELVEGDYPVVVYRAHITMRHLVLAAHQWDILHAIDGGATIEEALVGLVDAGVDPAELSGSLQAWFRQYAALGLVQPR